MNKKKKIALITFLIISVADIIITGIFGIRADMNYGAGYTIRFQLSNTTFDINDIKSIAKEVFKKDYVVKNVEFFNDNALIKVKDDPTGEQRSELCSKLNEKYSSSLTTDDLQINYEANVKFRTIVEPYIIPVGVSTILILVYFAIRFKGAKEMAGYIKSIVVVEVLFYSLYAICRVKFSQLTIPIALSLYALTTLIYTAKSESLNDKA